MRPVDALDLGEDESTCNHKLSAAVASVRFGQPPSKHLIAIGINDAEVGSIYAKIGRCLRQFAGRMIVVMVWRISFGFDLPAALGQNRICGVRERLKP